MVRRTLGRHWPGALAAAEGRWLFDFLTLLAALEAVDARPRLTLALLAYFAAQLLAQVPITPGGLGIVEAGMTGTLALAGVPAGAAAVATLAYRLASYWLPLPAGAVAWVVHRRRFGPADGARGRGGGDVSESTVEPARELGARSGSSGRRCASCATGSGGFIGLQGFDRAVALAGQAFTALIPLLIVYSAVRSDASGAGLRRRAHPRVRPEGRRRPRTCARRSPRRARSRAASARSARLILIFSALSFTRALQRLYQLAWGQPSLGMRAAKWGLVWLALVVVTITVRPPLLGAAHGVASVVLSIVVSGVVWLITPYVLLGRRVAWRRLGPMAAMTGVGMTALGFASRDLDAALGGGRRPGSSARSASRSRC